MSTVWYQLQNVLSPEVFQLKGRSWSSGFFTLQSGDHPLLLRSSTAFQTLCRARPAGAASGSRIPPPHLLHTDLPASIREALQVMQLHRKGHCVLIVLITVFTAGSVSAPMKVKLHDSATLSCSGRCSGLVRWTEFSKPTDPLAECDQTSCRSVKEGYQMIHDQYLKGDFSLIITDADFTKRGSYTSDCDGKDLCDVKLKIEPLNCTVQMEPGESLVLLFDVSDPVEVIYNSTVTAGASSGQICTVGGRSLQCKPEYTQRASLTSALELRNMTPSDSGLYAVMDKKNEDVIHTYTVTVQDVQDSWIWKTTYEKGNSDGYQTGVGCGALAVGVAALVIMFGVFFLGVFAAPWVHPQMDSCVQMPRSNGSSYRSQCKEKERGPMII
ncbi:hypothetical protein SRHO_G00261410 [Serrasalmus rhombeus]